MASWPKEAREMLLDAIEEIAKLCFRMVLETICFHTGEILRRFGSLLRAFLSGGFSSDYR